jgi:Glycosyl hydrolases family 38 N-terminal domain/Alpha mannosidase middle domain
MDPRSEPGTAPVRITVVPHTHWDREWYESFDRFLQRLVPMMDGLITLLDGGFPHFHLDGQTAMIDDYLAVRPGRAADIERHAREGRISVGPWFTQMDEFLVSGESHIRNLERGLARARELGARVAPVGYLPDQFGHIGQMPQILAEAGVDRAVVWRGVPSAIERTAFWWEAPDGTRVLTEYLIFGYSLGAGLKDQSEPDQLAKSLARSVEVLEPLSARGRFLITAGSDHHGPDPTLPDRLSATRAIAPELDAEIGPIAEHVAGPPPVDLPVWRGELRSSARAYLLAGVVSARAHQKRERACVEALVERYAEPLAALTPGFTWPGTNFDRIWQLLLWNGAHDSVCGCSADEVARDVDARYAEARSHSERIVDETLGELGRQVSDAGTLRFNPSPFEREGVPPVGWMVTAKENPPGVEPIEVAVRDDWVVLPGIELTVLDGMDVGDLYNFCPEQGSVEGPPRELRVDGSSITAGFEGCTVNIRVGRRTGEPFVRLEGSIQNERPDHRVRLVVRLPERTEHVVAGSPFELVNRGLRSEGAVFEPASPTWPARGVVLAGGVAILAEGVVEYEVIDGRLLAVTLLRCVGTISRSGFATRAGPAGPDVSTPDAQMIGTTAFALGIYSGAEVGGLPSAWERFALPLTESQAEGGGSLPLRGSLLELEGVELSSVRRHEGELEARVWNPTHGPIRGRVGDQLVDLAPARIATIRLSG